MITTVFFDMDGVLIDSEPYWQIAERKIFKNIFNVSLTDEDIHSSTGLKTTEVVDMHCKKYQITDYKKEEIGFEIEKEVIRQVKSEGKAKEGLYDVVEYIKTKNYRRVLVTSSSHYVLENIVEFLGLQDFFEKCFSAYDELLGKPDPAVYLSALDYVKESRENILVIEDSTNGVTAAYRAGLRVWAIPEFANRMNPKYDAVDKMFNTHTEILSAMKAL